MKAQNGIFISPTDEQLGKIWAACTLEGLPTDSHGVLQLLMLAVEPSEDADGEEPDIATPVDALNAWLREHPEQVSQAKAAGAQMLNSILNRFKKPK